MFRQQEACGRFTARGVFMRKQKEEELGIRIGVRKAANLCIYWKWMWKFWKQKSSENCEQKSLKSKHKINSFEEQTVWVESDWGWSSLGNDSKLSLTFTVTLNCDYTAETFSTLQSRQQMMHQYAALIRIKTHVCVHNLNKKTIVIMKHN